MEVYNFLEEMQGSNKRYISMSSFHKHPIDMLTAPVVSGQLIRKGTSLVSTRVGVWKVYTGLVIELQKWLRQDFFYFMINPVKGSNIRYISMSSLNKHPLDMLTAPVVLVTSCQIRECIETDSQRTRAGNILSQYNSQWKVNTSLVIEPQKWLRQDFFYFMITSIYAVKNVV